MGELFDAVLTWVNGNDPKHIEKRSHFLNQIEPGETYCGTLKWRFIETNEIKYCLYSIRKFAPWVNKIYLVTDDQCPDWLSINKQKELGVILIDHKIIFRDYLKYLPTFNSMTINTMLYRIPGLSNNFLVLNDDLFFINVVSPEDFLVNDKHIIRGELKSNTLNLFKKIKRLIKFILINNYQLSFKVASPHLNAANLVGLKNFHFEVAHAPDYYRLDLLLPFLENNGDFLEKNIRFRFRNENQTSVSAIFPNLLIKLNKAIVTTGNDAEMIIPGYGGLKGLKGQREKFDSLKRSNHGKKFLCFQDLAFLKEENPEEFNEVIEYLDKTIMSPDL